jgi:hypothetical protein
MEEPILLDVSAYSLKEAVSWIEVDFSKTIPVKVKQTRRSGGTKRRGEKRCVTCGSIGVMPRKNCCKRCRPISKRKNKSDSV